MYIGSFVHANMLNNWAAGIRQIEVDQSIHPDLRNPMPCTKKPKIVAVLPHVRGHPGVGTWHQHRCLVLINLWQKHKAKV